MTPGGRPQNDSKMTQNGSKVTFESFLRLLWVTLRPTPRSHFWVTLIISGFGPSGRASTSQIKGFARGNVCPIHLLRQDFHSWGRMATIPSEGIFPLRDKFGVLFPSNGLFPHETKGFRKQSFCVWVKMYVFPSWTKNPSSHFLPQRMFGVGNHYLSN